FFPLFLVFCFFCFSCKSPPEQRPSGPVPAEFTLRFDRIEASGIDRVTLFYRLDAENSGIAAEARIAAWEFLLNGEDLPAKLPKGKATALTAAPGEDGALIIRLDTDLPEESGDFDEYQSELRLFLAPAEVPDHPAGDTSGTAPGPGLSALAVFPRIRAPEFTITSIAVMRAELINIRFRVDLRIDNPNMFPVRLSSLEYELYGASRFWGDGKTTVNLEVPPGGYAETRLNLVMNFINMRRELLDEVIALGQVPYRFTGEALIDTGLPALPGFRAGCVRSGYSAVLE
ncbi:MAG: LEA type 2 family protein, partial [Treponema sp.]|nr:LEA type 2 family protein [Treponema sp.]